MESTWFSYEVLFFESFLARRPFTLSIQLEHGNLQKLAMLEEDFHLTYMSMFPGTRNSLLDAYNKTCFDHELENLTMVIEKTGTTFHKELGVWG
jgi:hypothetical protein